MKNFIDFWCKFWKGLLLFARTHTLLVMLLITSVFLFFGFGFAVPFFLEKPLPEGLMAYFGLIAGVVGFCLVVLVLGSDRSIPSECQKRRGGIWLAFSFLGYVGALALLIASGFLMAWFPMEYTKSHALSRIASLMIISYSVLVPYILACLVFLWSRFVVWSGQVVILDGRILYSGEQYTLWALRDYQIQIVSSEFHVWTGVFQVRDNRDIALDITCWADVYPDFAAARNIGVRPLDYTDFENGLIVWIRKNIQEAVERVGPQILFEGNLPDRREEIAGFPIWWDGRFNFATVNS